MTSKANSLLLTLLISIMSIFSAPLDGFAGSQPPRIIVHNQVLAKVVGKPISLVDVVKKLEMVFYQRYPELAHASDQKFEFFSQSWQYALRDMINEELIFADAQQRKLLASDGEIHQKLETIFGPKVIENLEKANLSYQDAFDMLRRELTVQKLTDMLQYKALHKISPKVLEQTYQKEFANAQTQVNYHYQVLSFNAENEELCKECAGLARTYLLKKEATAPKVKEILEKSKRFEDQVSIKLSSEIQVEEQNLAPTYQKALSQLTSGYPSEIIAKNSKNTNSSHYQLLWLKQKQEIHPPSFKEVEKQLHNYLFEQALLKEQAAYLSSLRETYSLTEKDLLDLPEGYSPFTYE